MDQHRTVRLWCWVLTDDDAHSNLKHTSTAHANSGGLTRLLKISKYDSRYLLPVVVCCMTTGLSAWVCLYSSMIHECRFTCDHRPWVVNFPRNSRRLRSSLLLCRHATTNATTWYLVLLRSITGSRGTVVRYTITVLVWTTSAWSGGRLYTSVIVVQFIVHSS